MRLPNSLLLEGDAFHEHQLMLESEIPAKFPCKESLCDFFRGFLEDLLQIP